MNHVTCRLTAKNLNQLRNPTLSNRVWATLFFISSEFLHFIKNVKNCDATWRDDAEHLLTAPPIKNFSLKIQDGGRQITLERPVLRHHEIFHFVDFQDGGCPSSWNFEILWRSVKLSQSFHIFRVFQVKCKNSPSRS